MGPLISVSVTITNTYCIFKLKNKQSYPRDNSFPKGFLLLLSSSLTTLVALTALLISNCWMFLFSFPFYSNATPPLSPMLSSDPDMNTHVILLQPAQNFHSATQEPTGLQGPGCTYSSHSKHTFLVPYSKFLPCSKRTAWHTQRNIWWSFYPFLKL